MAYNTAILIDLQNVGGRWLKQVVDSVKEVKNVSQIAVSRAYAHWTDQTSKTKQEIFQLAIDPVEVLSHDKNAADMQIVLDATELVRSLPEIEVFALVSGDKVFAALAKKLHNYNKFVVGCGNYKSTSPIVRDVCDIFIPISSGNGMANIGRSCKEGQEFSHDAITESDARVLVENTSMCKPSGTESEILNLLVGNPQFDETLSHGGGLPLPRVAEFLRNQFVQLDTKSKRWLVKLLRAACKDARICLAKALSGGEHRLFWRDKVPSGYVIVDGVYGS